MMSMHNAIIPSYKRIKQKSEQIIGMIDKELQN